MRIKKVSQTATIEGEVVNNKSNSTTNTYSCDYINGKILYDNASGNNGNVTLNESVNNYSYIEVIFANGDKNLMNSLKFYVPYTVGFNCVNSIMANNIMYTNTARYGVSGTTFTLQLSGSAEGGTVKTTVNSVFIYRVIGYK